MQDNIELGVEKKQGHSLVLLLYFSISVTPRGSQMFASLENNLGNINEESETGSMISKVSYEDAVWGKMGITAP